MRRLAHLGFTHIVNLQEEFDETELARDAGLDILWNPTGDDFQPKPDAFFDLSIRFALQALADPAHRVYVHCAAGIHRGPLTLVAILWAMGFDLDTAVAMVSARRPVADFPPVYLDSLRRFTESSHGLDS